MSQKQSELPDITSLKKGIRYDLDQIMAIVLLIGHHKLGKQGPHMAMSYLQKITGLDREKAAALWKHYIRKRLG